MTDYQRQIADAYMVFGPRHKLIARAVGTTPDGARSTLRKLRARGEVPAKHKSTEWPVPRP
jgi:hypothetical protein